MENYTHSLFSDRNSAEERSVDNAHEAEASDSSCKGWGVDRRQFCLTGGCLAVIAGLGGAGLITRTRSDSVYLRPPGALSEGAFLARCDRCQRCVQACPYNIVQALPVSFDLPSIGTPELSFKVGYCDFCMKCVDACPTGALSEGSPTYDNIGVAKIISDACVAWDWEGCTVCADKCPVDGAITLDDMGRPHVDETLCNGCGLCELECPSASLRAYNSNVTARGIYVVSRESAAAHTPGALTSEEFSRLRGKGGVDHE